MSIKFPELLALIPICLLERRGSPLCQEVYIPDPGDRPASISGAGHERTSFRLKTANIRLKQLSGDARVRILKFESGGLGKLQGRDTEANRRTNHVLQSTNGAWRTDDRLELFDARRRI
jgi:hypothetical protein